jgi:dUTP pyrophosphatase
MIVKIHRKIKSYKSGDTTVDLPLPFAQSKEAAAVDLQCVEDFVLPPGGRKAVETGLILRAPRAHCILVLPRSGLAAKKGVTVLNSPGLIDRDYCGPEDTVKVILHNTSDAPVEFLAGDRIGQLMLNPFSPIEWDEQAEANFAGLINRGGLGSTGGIKNLAEQRADLTEKLQ